MNNEDFYRRCAELLGTEYNCKPFPWTNSGITRWNNRVPGSGRYPGFGMIRVFGSQVHVALTRPITHHCVYQSKDDALDFLDSLQEIG
jgi:hypothetical protein